MVRGCAVRNNACEVVGVLLRAVNAQTAVLSKVSHLRMSDDGPDSLFSNVNSAPENANNLLKRGWLSTDEMS
jgi:uncharacterized alpha-E superfamily protein